MGIFFILKYALFNNPLNVESWNTYLFSVFKFHGFLKQYISNLCFYQIVIEEAIQIADLRYFKFL